MKTLISVEEDCVKHFTLASALKLLDDVVNVIVEIIAEIMADYPPCHDCTTTKTDREKLYNNSLCWYHHVALLAKQGRTGCTTGKSVF